MNLQNLVNYLNNNIQKMEFLDEITPVFTPTGISFEKDVFPEEAAVEFELPLRLLASVLRSYRRQASADPDIAWNVPLKGTETYLLQVYGLDNLLDHVLVHTRRRKLALLAK